MRIAFIAPKSLAEFASVGHYIFLLPNNLADEYKRSAMKKMLDNGAYENLKFDLNEYLKIAQDYDVNEIVVPDVVQNSTASFDLLTKYHQLIRNTYKDVAVVPQGKDLLDWLESYKQIIQMEGINTICLPKWLGKARPAIVAHLIRSGQWRERRFNYHLFGLDDVEELDVYRYLPANIRSVDTSMPFTNAFHLKGIERFRKEKLQRVDLATAKFTETQKRLAIENMKVLREIVGDI